ncbi:hypothetical protein Fmac_018893 [Flemingia macrophylla]|uniref:Uncharacterized protein n=1 Tax=Flemingia macrophylla TaxID=520843 RepID=A0ABD1M6C8_9FABA
MNIYYHRFFFLLLLFAICFATFSSGATLPKDEVEALKDIAETLGKTKWDFSIDTCSEKRNWTWEGQTTKENANDQVRCNCSFVNNTVCHVTNIDNIFENSGKRTHKQQKGKKNKEKIFCGRLEIQILNLKSGKEEKL